MKYDIEWKNIHIANLVISSNMSLTNYKVTNKIFTDNFFKKIYPYEFKSITFGQINDGYLIPKFFSIESKTKKKNKSVQINFLNDGSISNFHINPPPDNSYKSNFDKILTLRKFSDPISQIFQYFLYQNSNNRTIIDGRRIFEVQSNNIDSKNFKSNNLFGHSFKAKGLKITFPYYLSLWKDSKDDTKNIQFIDIYYFKADNTSIPVQLIVKTKKTKILINLISQSIVN